MIKNFLPALLTAAIALGTAVAGAHAEGSTTQVFKPARGVYLDVGSKRVAGYYTAGDHVCDLTLMFADQVDADNHVGGTLSRMNVSVPVGKRARIYTADGRAMEASCGTSANVMTLRTLAQTADSVK
jgi:hypothetical protein